MFNCFVEQLLNGVFFLLVIFHQVVSMRTQVRKYFLLSLIQMKNLLQSYLANRRCPLRQEKGGRGGPALGVKILLSGPTFDLLRPLNEY